MLTGKRFREEFKSNHSIFGTYRSDTLIIVRAISKRDECVFVQDVMKATAKL